jgi:hypothetical protein
MALNGVVTDRYNDQSIAAFYSNALKHLSSNQAARHSPREAASKILSKIKDQQGL